MPFLGLAISFLLLVAGAGVGGQGVCDAQCREGQRLALLQFYTSTGGDYWTAPTALTKGQLGSNWGTGSTDTQDLTSLPAYCDWKGILCCQLDNTVDLSTYFHTTSDVGTASCPGAGGVSGLALAYRNLTGTLPQIWEAMAISMQHMVLSGTALSGAFRGLWILLAHSASAQCYMIIGHTHTHTQAQRRLLCLLVCAGSWLTGCSMCREPVHRAAASQPVQPDAAHKIRIGQQSHEWHHPPRGLQHAHLDRLQHGEPSLAWPACFCTSFSSEATHPAAQASSFRKHASAR